MERPWSANELRRLGRRIRASPDPARDVAEYSEVMLWYNELATSVQERIAALDWSPLLGQAPVLSSRAKTIDTLKQKLDRDTGTPLQSVQDIAGVRFECEMTLSEQDAVAEAIAGFFDHEPTVIHDLRDAPHSGYRAVHVWLRLPEGRVEVQIRTAMQGAWANAYETLADRVGRDIRYGRLPDEPAILRVVRDLQLVSIESIAGVERAADASQKVELETTDPWLGAGAAGRGPAPARMMQIQEMVAERKRIHDLVIEQLEEMRRIVDGFVGTEGIG